MTCWEKAHTFYIPRGLFLTGTGDPINQELSKKEKKLKFVNIAKSGECYLAKRAAFGLTPIKRGGRPHMK